MSGLNRGIGRDEERCEQAWGTVRTGRDAVGPGIGKV